MTEEPTSERTPSRWTRKLARLGAALLLLAALIFTPPLFNVSRVQHRIAASISASLGRPVSMDKVTLHLLPMPGFTLQNLVVNEDPAFGSEPTIRAGKVEVTLRPSSLWRRQVELSSIKFEVDDNGSAPNLNLVRDAQGRWNIEGLLMHAAQVGIAPTAQRKAGPEPRFPYIEATGGRINVKTGNEKLPFALTEADFALWLPDPQQWRVRLEARPERTDTNVSDTGELRLEGSLGRATAIAEMPVDLHVSWNKAPLGEVSKVVLGSDADWRGTLMAEASLLGKLGEAELKTSVTLNELRRADYVPEKTLEVHAECSGTIDITTAVVLSPQCNIPAASNLPPAQISAVADRIDLAAPQNARIQIGSPGVSEEWLLDWVRLFSERLPACDTCVAAQAQGSVVYLGGASAAGGRWQGRVEGTMPNALDRSNPDIARLSFVIAGAGDEFVVEPINLVSTGKAPLTLSGTFDMNGYELTLMGTATEAQMKSLQTAIPPLGDGLEKLLPEFFPGTTKTAKVNILCSRKWASDSGTKETCSTIPMEAPATKPRHGTKHLYAKHNHPNTE
jgi:AsmA protein